MASDERQLPDPKQQLVAGGFIALAIAVLTYTQFGLLPLVGLFALGMLAFLMWFHIKALRTDASPWPARNLGVLTVVLCLAVAGAFVVAICVGGDWRPGHLWLLPTAIATLILVAYQWPTAYFRSFTIAMVLLALGLFAAIGRDELEDENARDYRVTLNDLDARLSETNLAGPIASAAKRVQEQLDKEAKNLSAPAQGAATEAIRIANSFAGAVGEKIHTEPPSLRDLIEKLESAPIGPTPTTPTPSASPTPSAPPTPALSDATPNPAKTARDDLLKAVEDLAGTISGFPKLVIQAATVQSDIDLACSTAGGQVKSQALAEPPPAKVNQHCVFRADQSPYLLRTAVQTATAQRSLANLALAVADGEARKAALTEMRKAELALAEANTAEAEATPRLNDVSAAMTSAAEAAVPGDWSWAPSTFLWVLLAIAAIFGYRQLEVTNGKLETGPVAFTEPAASKPDDPGELDGASKALLRYHLLTNLPEPGVQPGTSMTESITNLVSLEGVTGKILQGVLTLLKTFGFPLRGYEVSASLLKPTAAKDDPAITGAQKDKAAASGAAKVSVAAKPQQDKMASQVRLTIRSARSRRTLKTVTTSADTVEDALTEAAFEAASWIITRCRAVAPWMRRSENAGRAYRDFEALRGKGSPGTDERVKKMREVVRGTPGNAEMLVRLGYELDLRGDFGEALVQYQRAIQLWDDYGLARYRLAIARSNVAELQEAGNEKQDNFIESIADFRRLRQGLSLRRLAIGLLSIRERSAVPRLRERRDFCRAIEIAQAIVEARQEQYISGRCDTDLPPPALAKDKYGDSRHAIVHYNMACYLAVVGDTNAAFERLDEALTCPNAALLSGPWLAKDPDLQRLTGDPALKTKEKVKKILDRLPEKDTITDERLAPEPH